MGKVLIVCPVSLINVSRWDLELWHFHRIAFCRTGRTNSTSGMCDIESCPSSSEYLTYVQVGEGSCGGVHRRQGQACHQAVLELVRLGIGEVYALLIHPQ